MNSFVRELGLVGIIFLAVLAVQKIFHVGVVSYAPAPVLFAVITTWTIPRAWRYLLMMAIITELLTTLPFGILSLTVAIPLLIFLVKGRIDADISFSFLLLILITILFQLVTLMSFDVIHSFLLDRSQNLMSLVPWRLFFSSWLISSAFAFAACVMISNHMPQSEPYKVVSFTLRRHNG